METLLILAIGGTSNPVPFYILFGSFGLWYLLFPRSVIRLNQAMSLVKKNKPQPTLAGIRVLGAVVLLVTIFGPMISQR